MPDTPVCFVVSPIGPENSEIRKWADQTFRHLVAPAAESHGFESIRADHEDRAGIITTHIIQRLINSELVIADLTWRNPNVFYELALRHVTRRPLVQIIRAEETIPFDVQGMRTIKFELNDPDYLAAARKQLDAAILAVKDEDALETPVSQAVGQALAISSDDTSQVQLAEVMAAIQGLTAEVRSRAPRALASYTPFITSMQSDPPGAPTQSVSSWMDRASNLIRPVNAEGFTHITPVAFGEAAIPSEAEAPPVPDEEAEKDSDQGSGQNT
jgi:hypothetical protein